MHCVAGLVAERQNMARGVMQRVCSPHAAAATPQPDVFTKATRMPARDEEVHLAAIPKHTS